MADLVWYLISPPRDLELEHVTAILRPLAYRTKSGGTPIVIFEVWSFGGEISWRVGVDSRIADEIRQQLVAHMPRLAISKGTKAERPQLTLAADLRLGSIISPLAVENAAAVSSGVIGELREISKAEVAVVQWVVGPSKERGRLPRQPSFSELLGLSEPKPIDPNTKRLWRDKTTHPLLACRGRIGARSGHEARAYNIVRRVASAIRMASAPHAKLQLSKANGSRAASLIQGDRPCFSWGAILNCAELATVLAWPITETTAEDLPLVGGYVRPAPKELIAEHNKVAAGRSLGESLHPNQQGERVVMPPGSSLHHLHVIGPTGSGKSTLLGHLIQADIEAGHGVLVLEPRGDLVDDVLARIPKHRHEDVVVIDPADAANGAVVGLNVLAGPAETAERRADELIGLLAAMHGPNFGPRTSDVGLHAILTASRLTNGVLPDVAMLLTNAAFRRDMVAKVADPMVLGPWWAGYEALSEGERRQHSSPLLNKLRAFTGRQALRRMVSQPEPRFAIDDIFLKKRIVLVNLNRGLLGSPTASLLGALILSNAWAALQRRASLPREQRHMVGLYVDEFQDYVNLVGGLDFMDGLAQSRGLGAAWTLSHQNLGQLSTALEQAVIANARSRMSFRPSPSDAKALASAFGSVSAEDLMRLKGFEVVAQIHHGDKPGLPFGVRTLPLQPSSNDPVVMRRASTERYGIDGDAIDAALQERWNGVNKRPGRIGVKPRRAEQ